MAQLVVTFSIVAAFTLSEDVQKYSKEHSEIVYISIALTVVIAIAMSCCQSVRRRFPVNVIFLAIFTACEGLLVGSVAAFYEVDIVFLFLSEK